MKGNIGEWSEVYAFYHALASGCLIAADEHLRAIPEASLPIMSVRRSLRAGEPVFTIDHDEACVRVSRDGHHVTTLDRAVFAERKTDLQRLIGEHKTAKTKGTFELPQHAQFLTSLGCTALKATSAEKADIFLAVYDPRTRLGFEAGFSVKSQIGSPSTLLNAGKTTNVTFDVVASDRSTRSGQLCLADGERLVNITDLATWSVGKRPQAMMAEAADQGFDIRYHHIDNPTFAANVELIDSSMDALIGHALVMFYRDGRKSLADIVAELRRTNPLGFNNPNAYEYKFKKFLAAAALGMRPGTDWDGTDEATGGYLLVTATGDVLAYHTHNRARLEGYLLNHTALETPSTSRHEFGSFYEESGQLRVKLNLQIRFKY